MIQVICKLIVALIIAAILAIGSNVDAQERQRKPKTKASVVASLLRLADAAEKDGLKREATIILQAASEILKRGNNEK